MTGSPELWLVYGVNGELVAEYDAVIPGGTLRKEYGYRGEQMLVVYDAALSGDNWLKCVPLVSGVRFLRINIAERGEELDACG